MGFSENRLLFSPQPIQYNSQRKTRKQIQKDRESKSRVKLGYHMGIFKEQSLTVDQHGGKREKAEENAAAHQKIINTFVQPG